MDISTTNDDKTMLFFNTLALADKLVGNIRLIMHTLKKAVSYVLTTELSHPYHDKD